MAVSWRTSVFQKMICWNPGFYWVFGYALFGPSCQKREFWTPTKQLADNWRAHFGTFWGFASFSCFLPFFLFFLFSLFCVVFSLSLFVFLLEGLKVRWGGPKGHLTFGPKPSSFIYLFFEGSRVRWGGPKGHLTWPFLCFFPFLSLLLQEKPCFPHTKGHFC